MYQDGPEFQMQKWSSKEQLQTQGCPHLQHLITWIEEYTEYGDFQTQTEEVDKAEYWTRLDQKLLYDSPSIVLVLSLAATKVVINLMLKENKTYLLT